ncbi:hypothetical protein AMECASPLE_031769 [Ameca splendens]|uniref:Uncharacterized protein n=1 Tax=Ameca splendens TaxID=208324 RepID=A0ABV0YU60_9TELE
MQMGSWRSGLLHRVTRCMGIHYGKKTRQWPQWDVLGIVLQRNVIGKKDRGMKKGWSKLRGICFMHLIVISCLPVVRIPFK